MLCIYEVADGKIQKASFRVGEDARHKIEAASASDPRVRWLTA